MKKHAMMITVTAAALLLSSCGNTNSASTGTTAAASAQTTAPQTVATENAETGTKTNQSEPETDPVSDYTPLKEHIYYLLDNYTSAIVDGVEYCWNSAVKCDSAQTVERTDSSTGEKLTYCLVTEAPFTDMAGAKAYIEKKLTGDELKKISDEMFSETTPSYITENGKLYCANFKSNKGAEFGTILWDDMKLTNITDNSLTATVKEQIYDGETVLIFSCVKLGDSYDSWRISKYEQGEHKPADQK